MKKYYVEMSISAHQIVDVLVEAETEEQAYNKAESEWEEGRVKTDELEWTDFDCEVVWVEEDNDDTFTAPTDPEEARHRLGQALGKE